MTAAQQTPNPADQTGMATLAMALILLIATTIMSFSLARTDILEQRIAGNELRATEALHRAEAALEQGITILSRMRIPETDWSLPTPSATRLTTELTIDHLSLPDSSSGEDYQYRIELQRPAATPEFIEVIAEARSEADIAATLREYIQPQWPLSQTLPPLVVDGCISSGSGSTQLFPSQPGEASLATTLSHPPAGCLQTDGLYLEGGDIAEQFAQAGALWDALFSLGKEELIQRSAQEQAAIETGELDAAERSYYWINDPGGTWHESLGVPHLPIIGSPGHPVWILFAASAECPPLPSGITIYGIVYYETGASGNCDASGWGNAAVYGSVLVEGDLLQLSGGSRLYQYTHTEQGNLRDNLNPISAARLPGTWRDF